MAKDDGSAVVLDINILTLDFGGLRALDSVSLQVSAGELVAIIGPNGAGKTSLLNCITGFYKTQSGFIHYEGRSICRWRPDQIALVGVARTFQSTFLK